MTYRQRFQGPCHVPKWKETRRLHLSTTCGAGVIGDQEFLWGLLHDP